MQFFVDTLWMTGNRTLWYHFAHHIDGKLKEMSYLHPSTLIVVRPKIGENALRILGVVNHCLLLDEMGRYRALDCSLN